MAGRIKNIDVKLGIPLVPYVWSTNSILVNAAFSENRNLLNVNLKSFPGHKNNTVIISGNKPVDITIDGKDMSNNYTISESEGIFKVLIKWTAGNAFEKLQIKY